MIRPSYAMRIKGYMFYNVGQIKTSLGQSTKSSVACDKYVTPVPSWDTCVAQMSHVLHNCHSRRGRGSPKPGHCMLRVPIPPRGASKKSTVQPLNDIGIPILTDTVAEILHPRVFHRRRAKDGGPSTYMDTCCSPLSIFMWTPMITRGVDTYRFGGL